MKEVRKTQNQIIETQRKHTTIINDAIKLIKENTRKLMACSQYFYARDQILQLQTTIVSSLLAINNEIKAYRVATYSYKLNLLNSVMAMVNKVIPMSLLPRSALLGILQKVAFHQVQEADRLTLAIPTQNILTYYETKILTNVIVDPAGLLFKLAIPFASGSTALNLYRATAIPMPNGGSDGYAPQYDLESDYIAIAETNNRIALLSQPEIDNCVGSSSFSVCINSFSLETADDTCLGSLLIGNQFSALQNCNILTVKLPLKEKAKNLGNGRWLITSASKNFDMFLTNLTKLDHLNKNKMPGCQVCLIELKCGTKISTSFLEIRADIFSCHNDTDVKIGIELADPLKHLFNKLPDLSELPHISTMTEARQQIIEQVQLQMASIPEYHRKSIHKLDEISMPILLDMKTIKPSLRNEFSSSRTWKMSIGIGMVSFLISLTLHTGLSYFLHKYRARYDLIKKALVGDKKIQPKAILVVSVDEYQYLCLHPQSELLQKNIVINKDHLSQIFNKTYRSECPNGTQIKSVTNLQTNHQQFARNQLE